MSETRRILLIDDDAEFLEANKVLLEAHGYEVDTAGGGAAGIQSALSNMPHLIVLDVMMGSDTEGMDVSRRLRDMPELREIPVILLTGIKSAMKLPFSLEPDASWLPVAAVLEKPVPPDMFLARIEEILSNAS
jgi:two-component system alkaline phosphatase synthesis response regulator PhoP